jgi:hypothetical protein
VLTALTLSDDESEATMTAPIPEPKPEKPEHDWSKTITAVGGLVVAAATLLTALHTIGVIGHKEPAPAPGLTSVPTVQVTETQAPQPTVQPTQTPVPQLITLEDDFSNPKSGWDRGADSTAEWGYQDDEYRILVHDTDTTAWANTHEHHDLTNLVMVAEARRVAGPLDNEYGVIVRYQDRANFYLFTVSSDGQYAVQMLLDDNWKDLVEWTPSDAIEQDDGTNLLRVEAKGPEMRFLVNGELLCTVQDSTISSGSVGLAAGTFTEPEVEVRFDNLLVRETP